MKVVLQLTKEQAESAAWALMGNQDLYGGCQYMAAHPACPERHEWFWAPVAQEQDAEFETAFEILAVRWTTSRNNRLEVCLCTMTATYTGARNALRVHFLDLLPKGAEVLSYATSEPDWEWWETRKGLESEGVILDRNTERLLDINAASVERAENGRAVVRKLHKIAA